MDGTSITYFWDGSRAILVYWGNEEKDAWLWRRGLKSDEELPLGEISELQSAAETSRKRVFKVNRFKKFTFHVDQRGIFVEEE